ncbi:MULTISPECIES: cupin domain-containing protein [unclassified Beijerinckia]|uniref:cupin domain-containing protein n=1 Tax=unclassified Beijerinckia TaxID=2638183 RepID=UPI00089C0C1A|nr:MULTISPECIES: cupin domain-containing protein [unclassified Beijerinckia]MDH7797672.1 mannose-6-phosphate isomerase-like protein (cupin superfamily) [Beijerinckia sp. GAS462]SEC94496.1 Cupin domain-containing protein [Beijerinckia sp. 28-YEA-48]
MARQTRRVIVDHDSNGKAIVTADGPTPNVKLRQATGITSTQLWTTDQAQPDLSSTEDMSLREFGVAPPPGGNILRIVDFPPVSEMANVDNAAMLKEMGLNADSHGGAASRSAFMHRTKSIDYAIVLEGEIDMLMDDSEVHLKAGDVLIQKATNHAWVNNSKANCRIAFVLIDAQAPSAWKKTPGH